MQIEVMEYESSQIRFTIYGTTLPLDIKIYDFSAEIWENGKQGWSKMVPIEVIKTNVLEAKWPPLPQGDYAIRISYKEKKAVSAEGIVWLYVHVLPGLDGIKNPSHRYFGEGFRCQS